MRVAVKRLNLDRHPEPLTRRQTGEVLVKIDISVTCINVDDQSFGSVYPQPPSGGSGRILQTCSSGPPGSVVLSHGRNFPSRIETVGRLPAIASTSRTAGTFRVGLKLPFGSCSFTRRFGRTAGTFRVGLKPFIVSRWTVKSCRTAGTFRVGLKPSRRSTVESETNCHTAGTFRVGLKRQRQAGAFAPADESHGRNFPSRDPIRRC